MARLSAFGAALVAGIAAAVAAGGYGAYAIFRPPPKHGRGLGHPIEQEPRAGDDRDRPVAVAPRPRRPTGIMFTPPANGSAQEPPGDDAPDRRAAAPTRGDDPGDPGAARAPQGPSGGDPAALVPAAFPDERADGGLFGSARASLAAASADAGDLVFARPDAGGACPSGMIDVGSFCIDPTEVTNAAYAAFLGTRPSPRWQPAYCAWNKDYEPPNGVPPNDQRPVVQVNWCDARAFCAAAGKRLCGRVGGGPIPYADFADADQDEWFHVCSNGGTTQYSYGNDFDGTRCGMPDQPVGATPTCSGPKPPFSSVVDMSGGVWEWEDSCYVNKGAGDTCRLRGGSAMTAPAETTCNKDNAVPRNSAFANVGFRCCADHAQP
jgi:formylglycine-generating enzyme